MKLITWNIQWARGVDGRVDLARVVTEASQMADFDVLCLQEVADNYPELPGCDRGNQFERIARTLTGYTPVEGPSIYQNIDGRVKRFGNLMLTRYPMLMQRVHPLPWPPDPGKLSMPRVAIEALLWSPFGVVRVTTTHLEYYSEKQRLAQAKHLHDLHGEACLRAEAEDRRPTKGGGTFSPLPQTESAILVGDFNCVPGSATYNAILQPHPRGPAYLDAWRVANSNLPHAHTIGVHDKVQWPEGSSCVDFVFVSEDLASRIRKVDVNSASQASDHQPVLIELSDH